jgi:hypothetical protein
MRRSVLLGHERLEITAASHDTLDHDVPVLNFALRASAPKDSPILAARRSRVAG